MKKIIILFALVGLTRCTPVVAQVYQLSPEFSKKIAVLDSLQSILQVSCKMSTIMNTLTDCKRIVEVATDCLKSVKNEADYISLYDNPLDVVVSMSCLKNDSISQS